MTDKNSQSAQEQNRIFRIRMTDNNSQSAQERYRILRVHMADKNFRILDFW